MLKFTTNLRFFFSNKKDIFLLFGPPAVGKGSIARLLEKDHGLHYVGVNEELKKIMKSNYTNGL
jgi:replication-associated recombination protein RarA